MKHTIFFGVLLFFLLAMVSCRSQNDKKSPKKTVARNVGGPCEGCEALHEFGDVRLTNTDTLPSFFMAGPKLKIVGTVYNPDKSPAENVIIYVYHTDRKGIYPKKGDEKGWTRRHGYLRGWAKTNDDGMYTFFTFRPASYPNRSAPEHIHMTVKEPTTNAYYIDDIMFDDDSLLTKTIRKQRSDRAGSGIVKLQKEDSLLIAKRDIFLGRNIPDY
ncbi:intradiol ring-cleavage dioxygenase [Allomuricauda sp. d1]|uniref:dioxygenase family protein n=1 Tax=Allomuricauda sp. d1 TaxID=3136725 RepID=UPI0031E4284B